MKPWQHQKAKAKRRSRLPAPRAPTEPTVEIRPEAWGCGFDVTVRPEQELALDREFPTLDEALGYAQRISLDNGWPVVNRAG